MNGERYHSPLVKHGRKKPASAGSGKSYCYWIFRIQQPIAAAFFRQIKVGLDPQLRASLQVLVLYSRMMLLSGKLNIFMLRVFL